MITLSGLNKWTPAIYKSESPVNWTAERNRSINFRKASKERNAKQIKRDNAVLISAK